MKKYFTLICVIFLIQYSQAQKIKTFKPFPFNSIVAFGNVNIELQKSKEDSIVVDAAEVDLSEIKVYVEDKNLKISLTDKIFSGHKQARIVVYYKDIQGIALRGGAQINDYPLVETDKIELLAGSGSVLYLKLKANKLKADIGQGSTITLEGTCGSQTVEATTGGIYNCYDLKSDTGKIKTSTGGIAKVYCLKYFDAAASLGGEISYRGNPERMNQKTTLGGKIEQVVE